MVTTSRVRHTHAHKDSATRSPTGFFLFKSHELLGKNRPSQTLPERVCSHSHHPHRCLCARALTRSSLVVSSFGIQLHPQSKRPPSRSRREQSTYADSGCGAQHSGKQEEETSRSENKLCFSMFYYYFTILFTHIMQNKCAF